MVLLGGFLPFHKSSCNFISVIVMSCTVLSYPLLFSDLLFFLSSPHFFSSLLSTSLLFSPLSSHVLLFSSPLSSVKHISPLSLTHFMCSCASLSDLSLHSSTADPIVNVFVVITYDGFLLYMLFHSSPSLLL